MSRDYESWGSAHTTPPRLEALYDPDERDRAIFGEHYISGGPFVYGEWRLVARFQKRGGDGQDVEIDECRMPARFFRLRALAGRDSVDGALPAFTLSTGSGDEVGQLMVALAQQIVMGMVGLRGADDEGGRE